MIRWRRLGDANEDRKAGHSGVPRDQDRHIAPYYGYQKGPPREEMQTIPLFRLVGILAFRRPGN